MTTFEEWAVKKLCAQENRKITTPYEYDDTMRIIGKFNLGNILASGDFEKIKNITYAYEDAERFDLLAMLCDAYVLGHMAGIRAEREIRHKAEDFTEYNDTLQRMAYEIYYKEQLQDKQAAVDEQREALTEIRARLGLCYSQDPEPDPVVDADGLEPIPF